MSGNNETFNDRKVNKNNFYETKRLFKIDDIDVDKILINKKEPCGEKSSFKYFFDYEDHDYIGPLCIKVPQMIGYVKCFDNNKTMSFKIADCDLLKKYTKIWGTVSNLMNIEFDSETVYGDTDKHIKTKIKMHEDKVNTGFQDSVVRVNKKYYFQTLLEECLMI